MSTMAACTFWPQHRRPHIHHLRAGSFLAGHPGRDRAVCGARLYRHDLSVNSIAWTYWIFNACAIQPGNLCRNSLVLFALPANDVEINKLLRWLFLINGAGLIMLIARYSLAKARKGSLDIAQLTLLYWLVSSATFIVVFAPFMATRHVLLSLPPVILLLYAWVVEGKSRDNLLRQVSR